ncbi:MAG: Uma2 family endonuclease [Cyanobacteriota bacterium]|nr:Uma2 family endonuclease [Cyanobacteriota bacterium]
MATAPGLTVADYQKLIEGMVWKTGTTEQVYVLSGVSWPDYEALLARWGDEAPALLKFTEGQLEIMAPSRRHETGKKMLALLLETYFLERNIRFYPLGSLTLRREGLQKGVEPDECYCLHQRRDIPDLAIEVVVTSGGVDSLTIYQDLGVREVWFWQAERLTVYVLGAEGYVQSPQSGLLPDLDLATLAHYGAWEEPFDAVLAFREQLRR